MISMTSSCHVARAATPENRQMVRGRSSRLAQWTFNFNEHDKQSLSDDALAGMRRSGGTNRAPCVDVVSNLVAHRRESWQADHANAATTWKAGKSRGVPFLVALLLLAGCMESGQVSRGTFFGGVAVARRLHTIGTDDAAGDGKRGCEVRAGRVAGRVFTSNSPHRVSATPRGLFT
jgi:hypothetical protein